MILKQRTETSPGSYNYFDNYQIRILFFKSSKIIYPNTTENSINYYFH